MKTLGTEQKSMRNASSNDVWHHRIQNLCCHPFTRKREADIFKNLHYGAVLEKSAFLVPVYVRMEDWNAEKKFMFSKYQDMCGQGLTDDQK